MADIPSSYRASKGSPQDSMDSRNQNAILAPPASPVPTNPLLIDPKHFTRPSFSDPFTMVTFHLTEGLHREAETTMIHAEHIFHYSPVIRHALSGRDGKNLTYNMNRTTHRAFRLLIQWIYYQQLNLLHLQIGVTPDTPEGIAKMDTEHMTLIELWILAERLDIPVLMNLAVATLRAAIEDRNGVFGPETLHWLYKETKKGCKLRRLVVILTAAFMGVESFLKKADAYPREMLVELVALLLEQGGNEVDERMLARIGESCYVAVEEGN